MFETEIQRPVRYQASNELGRRYAMQVVRVCCVAALE